jgi:hypothetical protein
MIIGMRLGMIVAVGIVAVALLVPAIGYSMMSTPEQGTLVRVNYAWTFDGDDADITSLTVDRDAPVEKPSYWSYWSSFWTGADTAELVEVDNALFALSYWVLFEGLDGKTWITNMRYEYNTLGSFTGSFEFELLDKPGKYTTTVSVLLESAENIWNVTIDSEKSVFITA